MAREMRESRGVLPLAAHVVKDEHGADHGPHPIANRSDAVIDRHGGVVASPQDDIAIGLDDAAVAQRAGDGIGRLQAGAFIHHRKDGRHGTPAGILVAPAGQPLRHRVEEFDASRRVDGDHRIGDRSQRDLRLFLLLEDLRFGLLAIRDVGQ